MIRVLILCSLANFQTVKPTRVSSKLDFGQDDHPIINIKSPGITSSNVKDETTVICSGSGCNKTITTEDSDKDIVNDVVVHVKTSVNIPKTKNETIDDTPDVPIVLGYGNSQFLNDPQPIQEPKPHYRKYHVPNRNKQVSFENDVMRVPYFEPTFHKYHFGEQPPLQYVWPPQGGAAGFNPVEFKRFEKPTVWNRPVGSFSSQIPAGSNGYYTTCTCHNPGLNWYPTTPTWNINQRGNLNTGIDDKLAPLN